MRTSFFFVALVLAVGLAGCAKKQPTEPPPTVSGQTISGVVRAGAAPLANAAVSLNGAGSALTSTAANGSYSFTGLSSGSYLVHVQHAGHSMSPSGAWVDLSASTSNVDFRLTPASTRFDLTGTISGTGAAGVRMTLSGDNVGNALSLPSGDWSIPNLIIGDYTLTPTKDGYHFSPPSRTIVGNVSFSHPETGNGTLGAMTITSVTHGPNDATPFFEITSPPVDGVGTIRARRASEIATGSIAAYDAMWNAGGTVVVAINSTGFGLETIEIGLGPNPTIVASAAHYIVSQTLTPLHGNDFTAIAH